MPLKFAKSKDPEHQALKSAKKGWNLAAKTFIQKLIEWKKGFNGRGSPSMGVPPSNLTEHMPDEMKSLAAEIEGNFAQLMSAAEQIEAQQAAYAAKKQQQRQEREQQKSQPPEQPQMQKPASIRAFIKKASRNEMAKGKVIIKNHEFDTLLAQTANQQEQGLMYVPPPAPAMAFPYRRPQYNTMWMKNTIAPLDIVFALHGKIIGIYQGKPYSTATIGGHYSDLVVELNEGTCKALGIKEGDDIKLLSGD